MGGHGHGQHHDEEETGEWLQLLKPSELREVQDIERARKEVERQIIHANQAKLAGRSEAERRGKTPSSSRIAGAGVGGHDLMSHLYAQDVDVEYLAKLLPRPGDGEKQKQMAWQRGLDGANSFLSGPSFGIMSTLVTALSVCIYLYETTLDADDDHTSGGGWDASGHDYPGWFSGMEIFFLAFFVFELGFRSILADQHSSFWLSTTSLVDVLSVLPSLLFVAFDLRLWGFLRFLRLFRWADISTLLDHRRTYESKIRDDDGVEAVAEGASKWKHESLVTALKLAAFVARYVLVFAGALLLLDRAEGGIEDISVSDAAAPLEFTSALYMAAMMLSTIGEGGHGPVPVSAFARVASAVAVLVFLPLAAIRVADVIKHSSTIHNAVRPVSSTPGPRERYVVLCGSVTAGNLKARLQELFHADHGKHNIRYVRVIVLAPEPPNARINALLERPRYRGRVTYIQGSPLDDDSLLKAGVDDASAVMVLADKATRNSHAEDMNLSLQSISIATHCEIERRQGFGPRLLVELVDPNASLHLKAAGIRQVVSSAQLKMSVLGQSCLCPGWSAVVANLIESRPAIPPKALQQGSWLAEYFVGAKKTFYSVEFSPAYEGCLFGDTVVHIYEHFELILVAIETKRADEGDEVMVNPPETYRIGRGDRGFVLAETWADARVIWDYMSDDGSRGGAVDAMGLADRFGSPEEEEAMALETMGTAGVAAMGPQAFVDSMLFNRTLLQCQRKLPRGEAPDAGLVLEWARQFQESDGVSDEMVVRKILASSGLVPPRHVYLNPEVPPVHGGRTPVATATSASGVSSAKSSGPSAALAAVAVEAGVAPVSSTTATAKIKVSKGTDHPTSMPDLVELSPDSRPEGGVAPRGTNTTPTTTTTTTTTLVDLDGEGVSEGAAEKAADGASSAAGDRTVEPSSVPKPAPHGIADDKRASTASSVCDMDAVDFTGEEILSALRTMEVSSLDGEEARRRLLALRSAAKATPATASDDSVSGSEPRPEETTSVPVKTRAKRSTATMTTPSSVAAVATNTSPADTQTSASLVGGARERRQQQQQQQQQELQLSAPVSPAVAGRLVTTARHLVGHVVVLGFPPRPSYLECFLRPLKGWTGGAGVGGGREAGGGGVPVVLMTRNLAQLATALDVVQRNGHVNTSEVYLLAGSPVSQSDLENAGIRTAKAVLVMKDPKSRLVVEGTLGDPLRDAETLVSFIKMEDGLLTPSQHVVVELESRSNVRFLHARTDAKTLHAIAGLGGAGAGGAADEAHYLWPKYAAGMTYNSSFVDALFPQAFYRPSRIALIERLLLLDRSERVGQSGMAESSASRMRSASMTGSVNGATTEDASVERETCLRQMSIPPSFVGHSFGEMFQHLAAPPLRCVAFALLRARGTRDAPEPYVYTGPRADTVLHRGDRVFVLGKPPII